MRDGETKGTENSLRFPSFSTAFVTLLEQCGSPVYFAGSSNASLRLAHVNYHNE